MPGKNSWVTQQVSRCPESAGHFNRERKTSAGRVQKLYQRGHDKQDKEEIDVLSETEQTTRVSVGTCATGHTGLQNDLQNV